MEKMRSAHRELSADSMEIVLDIRPDYGKIKRGLGSVVKAADICFNEVDNEDREKLLLDLFLNRK